MTDTKNVISVIAIALTVIGYVPYIRDTLKGKTKPHVFSWFLWGGVTALIYALQASAGAGSGSWVTLAVAIIMLSVFFISLRNGNKDIKLIDIGFFILALFALGLWLIVDQPVLSIILLSAIDMLAFAPTIRKSWNAPYSETLSFYVITTFRHGLTFFALAEYNIVTYLFPATWVIANAGFAAILILRRRKIAVVDTTYAKM